MTEIKKECGDCTHAETIRHLAKKKEKKKGLSSWYMYVYSECNVVTCRYKGWVVKKKGQCQINQRKEKAEGTEHNLARKRITKQALAYL